MGQEKVQETIFWKHQRRNCLFLQMSHRKFVGYVKVSTISKVQHILQLQVCHCSPSSISRCYNYQYDMQMHTSGIRRTWGSQRTQIGQTATLSHRILHQFVYSTFSTRYLIDLSAPHTTWANSSEQMYYWIKNIKAEGIQRCHMDAALPVNWHTSAEA